VIQEVGHLAGKSLADLGALTIALARAALDAMGGDPV
jgi:hypothetical protein